MQEGVHEPLQRIFSPGGSFYFIAYDDVLMVQVFESMQPPTFQGKEFDGGKAAVAGYDVVGQFGFDVSAGLIVGPQVFFDDDGREDLG